MKTKNKLTNLKSNQSGIASMVIVILIMTLLTLIVLSMAQNANREQRQSLDRQLNSQAFYAAESGISDAKDYISESAGTAPIKKEQCGPLPGAGPEDQFPTKSSKVSDPSDYIENVRYSCVLYNRIPNTLKFSGLGVGTSEITPIEDAGGLPIKDLTFSWTREDGGSDFSGCQGPSSLGELLPQIPNNCDAGMLRVELIDPSASNRQALLDRTFLAYFKPTTLAGSGSIGYGSASGQVDRQGAIANGGCNASGGCSLTITNIGSNKLYLHLRSIYQTNDITVSGTTLAGNPLRFREAQVEVDSTGRANDILKRLQVRVPLTGLNSDTLPEFVLQTSKEICKQLQVQPTIVGDNCSP